MATWQSVGVAGGGLAQDLDIHPSVAKILLASDTQGPYYDDAAAGFGGTVRVLGTGIGVNDGYRQIAGCLWSRTEGNNVGYLATNSGLAVTVDNGAHWTLRSGVPVFKGNGANSSDPIPSENQRRPAGRLLFDEASFLWAADYNHGILRSADHGSTWPVTCNMNGTAPGVGSYFAQAIYQDPVAATTMWAGFREHSSGTTGFGGLWKCANAHTTTSTPNFLRQAGLPTASVEDIVVIGPAIFMACAGGGVWMAPDNTANLALAASFVNIGTAGTGQHLGSVGQLWMALDVYDDGTNWQVVTVCSEPQAADGYATIYRIQVNKTTLAVTRTVLADNSGMVNSATLPGAVPWWNAGTPMSPGKGGFVNPQVRWDPLHLGTRIYVSASQGLWRSLDSGATWQIASSLMPQFLGRHLCCDEGNTLFSNPGNPGWAIVGTSDWREVEWSDGVAASGTTTFSTDPPDGGKQGYAFAVDPVDGTVYMGHGEKYSLATLGQVSQHARGSTAWTQTGGAGATSFNSKAGGVGPAGLCALRAGTGTAYTSSDPKCVLAATQSSGMWRYTPAGGWVQTATNICKSGSGVPPGYWNCFAHVPGSQHVYCFIAKEGLYHSSDFGQTWTLRDGTLIATSKVSKHVAVYPTAVGEVWVSSQSHLYKITGANTTSPVKTLISAVPNAGPVRIRNSDGAIYVCQQDQGSGAKILVSTDHGATFHVVGTDDGSFGQLNFNPECIAFGPDGRVTVSGSNVAVTTSTAAAAGGSFSLVQQSNNIVGSAGTFNAWFNGTSVGSTLNHLLSVRLSMSDCAMTVTPPNANWELIADAPSGTTTGQARMQTWVYRRCAAGIGAAVGSAAVFTYSNSTADVRGRLFEHSSASAFQYVDRAGAASALASNAAPGPVVASGASRVTGGIALVGTSAWHSNVPTGQSWTTPGGWTNDGSAANQANAFHLAEQIVPAGTETFTDSFTLGTGVMTSWAQTLVTLWSSPVQVTLALLASGQVGNAYTQSLATAAVNGTGPYSWQIWDGALPTGLGISGTQIVGTPAASGTFTVRLAATDSVGNMAYSATLTLTVSTGISITSTSPPSGAVSEVYNTTLATSGGTGTKTWTRPSGTLPTGLSLSAAGVISGNPTAVGDFTFDAQVTDANGATDRATLTITINPALSIATTLLPIAFTATDYRVSLIAHGGLPDYAWAQISGVLPAGLAFTSDGVIAGQATASTNTTIGVQVTDSGGATATQLLSLVVSDPPTDEINTSDSLVLAGQFELLGGGVVSDHPACPGAIFRLGTGPGWEPGMPQPVTDLVVTLGLDGERPLGRRASNRSMTIPIVILAPDRDTLAAAREAIWQAVNDESWPLVWARTGSLPLIFDCYRAAISTYTYSIPQENYLVSTLGITCQASPYGRSTDVETLSFAAPSASFDTPISPVRIDDFSVVSSSTQPTNWTRSTRSASGAFSARWSKQTRNRPLYTHTLSSPVDITGLDKLTFWLGLGTTPSDNSVWHKGKVICDVVLTDTSGSTLEVFATRRASASADPTEPGWTRVSTALPTSSSFDATSLISYSIRVWNTTDPDGSRVLQAECYLSGLEASPSSYGQVQPRGAVYNLRGITGTTRSPLSIQVQPGLSSISQVWEQDRAGTFTFTPTQSGGTLEAWGAGGGGGGGAQLGSSSDDDSGGGGGGGGEYAAEPGWPLAPGQTVTVTVGAPGNGGAHDANGTAGSDTVFTIGGVEVLRAHGGTGGNKAKSNQSNPIDSPGGTGSRASVHFDGGDGSTASWGSNTNRHWEGSGGGGSGGYYQAGNPGAYPKRESSGSSNFLGGLGGSAVAGGGPGGNGGNNGTGRVPSSGPGGGGGGGDGNANAGGGNGFSGQARITYGIIEGLPIQALVVHQPGPDAPSTSSPLVRVGDGIDIPDGNTEYRIISPASNSPARFRRGTYMVVACASAWHGSASRAVTVNVKQYETTQDLGVDPDTGSEIIVGQGRATVQTVSRTLAPSGATNGLAILGQVVLPCRDMADDQQQAAFFVTVTSGDTADRFNDVLLLDTEGSTVILNTAQPGYNNVWIDEPEPDKALGLVLGSYSDRASASSILDDTTISGPPFSVEPGDNWIMAYSPTGAPGMFGTHTPRWYLDRLA